MLDQAKADASSRPHFHGHDASSLGPTILARLTVSPSWHSPVPLGQACQVTGELHEAYAFGIALHKG